MATTKKQGEAKQPAKKTEQKAPEATAAKTETAAAAPEDRPQPTKGAELTQEEKEYAEAYDSYHKTFGNFPSPNLETKQILEAIEDHAKAQSGAAAQNSGAATEAEEEAEAEAPETAKKLDGVLEPADDEIVVTDGVSAPRIMKKATWDLAKNSAGKRWKEVPSLPKELKSK